jgi:hypothetical protein
MGNLTFNPITINYENEKEKQETINKIYKESSQNKTEEELTFNKAIDVFFAKFISEIKKANLGKVVVLVDDLHLIQPDVQIDLVRSLLYISAEIRKLGIKTSVKLFSAMNFYTDISHTLKLTEKELQLKNIEASLVNMSTKRRAFENLSSIILSSNDKFSESEINEMLPREVIDQILVLSGGHPRRFLQMASRFLDRTKGISSDNLFDSLLISSAEVVSNSRKNLIVELGIDSSSNEAESFVTT